MDDLFQAASSQVDLVQHEGSSVNPARQEAPHPHSIVLDPAHAFAVVPDLGIDKVMIYRFDRTKGTLTLNESVSVQPGAGPRHFAFHPQGRYAYLINELDATMTVFAYDPARGALTALQTLDVQPDGVDAPRSGADIHVTPSGAFVYGSLRGPDSLVRLAVDAATGQLTQRGHTSTQGQTPRNFAIDPSGTFVLAANQDSHTVVTFRITSPDIVHGVHVPFTNMSTMVIPGYISEVTTRFSREGEAQFLCNEYCGLGHDYMWSKLKVVAKG